MRDLFYMLYFITCSNFLWAQSTYFIESSDSNGLDEFRSININGMGCSRDSERTKFVSFSINLPKGYLNVSSAGDIFVFFYEDTVQMLVKTRLFGEDSNLVSEHIIESKDINSETFWPFEKSYEKDKFGSGFNVVLKDRVHYFLNKNGNTIFLFNIKPEELDLFLKSANSFAEIIRY